MHNYLILLLLNLMIFSCAQKPEDNQEDGLQSFGEPANTPQIFAPNTISLSSGIEFGLIRNHYDNEIYYSKLNPSNGNISVMVLKQTAADSWSLPQKALFSNSSRDASPSFTKKGKRVYFTSFRNSAVSRIWYSDRKSDNTWDEPKIVQLPDSIKSDIRNICFVNDTTLYFDMHNGSNNNDIFRAVLRGDICISIEHTGPKINSVNPEVEAMVSPDESYMIFYSTNRAGHTGDPNSGDLYISYKENGQWGDPLNMGTIINSVKEENWPTIDFKNNVLYYSSNRSSTNGFPDIYWVKLENFLNLK